MNVPLELRRRLHATIDPDDDRGFTLVELLVATLLFSLVGSLVAAIFISTLNVQQTVTGVSASTSSAQSAANNVDSTLRNASGYLLTASGSDQLLVARVAGTGSTLTWSCRAFYYSASAGSIRAYTGAVGTKITAPTSTSLATWGLLTTGVTPRSGSTIFTDVDGVTMQVAFDVTGANKKVAMQFSTSRPIGVATITLAESDKCY
ncbi:MAG: prepilin-type N-terminal cleavage/methylation domain-containing protein [Pseudolysinimonas sp.]|uniref:prepilin-type N-terminal cleavage/methylation domain-containing protein n=1 Tax=Pseudolysinimonas sp. TaxID=2680009 RepID=UPI003263C849